MESVATDQIKIGKQKCFNFDCLFDFTFKCDCVRTNLYLYRYAVVYYILQKCKWHRKYTTFRFQIK